jgi:4-amino-4-deoxy-L-arabinose transferase-like glycosyltransferase
MNVNGRYQKLINTASRPVFFYFLVILFSLIPFFYHLGKPVLNHWDESRRAVNAFEMMNSGELIVTYYDGEPEMWGTKPPLLTWMQALSFKVLGTNELALRLPVALSGLLLALLLLWFCGSYLKSYLTGIASAMILFTSQAMISVHGARSGDFDLPLILFTTAGAIFLFLSTESECKKERGRYIILFFGAFTLAALTKGIAAFMLAPGMLLYLILSKNLVTWLRSRNFWIGTAMLLFLFGGYYFLRELKNPGYLRAVVDNEMTGRYFETLEENQAPFVFFIRGFYQWRFGKWFYLVPLGILLGYWTKERKITGLLNFSLLVTIPYVLIISASKTKLEWYDLPVFPFLVIMAALFFHVLIRSLKGEQSVITSSWGRDLATAGLLFFFFITPYYRVYKQNREGTAFRQDKTYHLSHYLRNLQGDPSVFGETLRIIHKGDKQQYLFYLSLLERDGTNIRLVDPRDIREGRTYIVHQENVMKKLQEDHHLQPVKLSEGIFSVTLDDHFPGDTP